MRAAICPQYLTASRTLYNSCNLPEFSGPKRIRVVNYAGRARKTVSVLSETFPVCKSVGDGETWRNYARARGSKLRFIFYNRDRDVGTRNDSRFRCFSKSRPTSVFRRFSNISIFKACALKLPKTRGIRVIWDRRTSGQIRLRWMKHATLFNFWIIRVLTSKME